MITLRDIAARAGVSVMTVSRALRNQESLAPQTRARVQRIAREMGYRPNPLVSALMTYRKTRRPVRSGLTLGFVTNFSTQDGWRYFGINSAFFEGISSGADAHGYKVEEFWLREPRMTGKRLSRVLYNRNIAGLIVAPLPVSVGHLRLEWERFSAVTVGYSLVWPPLHRAVNHQFRSMRLAIRRLRKRGYRRLGLALRSSSDERVDHHWMGAYLVEQEHSRKEDRLPMLELPDHEWTESNFVRWFKRNRPQVVISQHEEILDWLDGIGMRVPRDVGFVHLNCPEPNGTFAGIYQNGPTVGRAAVDYLVGMIQRNERGIPELPQFILVDGTWQDGWTLRKPD